MDGAVRLMGWGSLRGCIRHGEPGLDGGQGEEVAHRIGEVEGKYVVGISLGGP